MQGNIPNTAEQAAQAIAAQEQGGAVAPADLVRHAPVGMEDYDAQDFRVPRISIVQTGDQMTTWDAKGGQFHNLVTNENHDKLVDVIVLGVKKAKWFGPSFTDSQAQRDAGQEVKAWCRSGNGRTPDADLGVGPDGLPVAPQASACKICPRAKFIDKGDGTKAAPQCTDIRKLLIMLPDGTVGLMVVRKTAMKDVDNFVQPFFLKGLPMFAFRATIGTRSERAMGNTFYIPVLTPHWDKPVAEEEQAQLSQALAGYKTLLERITDEDTHGGEGTEEGTGGYAYGPTSTVPDPAAYQGGPTLQAEVTPVQPAATPAAQPSPPPPPPAPTPQPDAWGRQPGDPMYGVPVAQPSPPPPPQAGPPPVQQAPAAGSVPQPPAPSAPTAAAVASVVDDEDAPF